MDKVHPLAVPALILAAVLGGLAPIFGKLALRQFDPYYIIFLRFGLALIILFILLVWQKDYRLNKKDLPLILIVSLLGTINVFCFIIGLQYTTSIMSQVMYLLVPLIVLLLSKFFLNEHFKSIQIIGILLGLGGAGLIILRTFFDNTLLLSQSLGTFKGNAILLIGVIGWSLYLIFSKKASFKYSPLAMTTYTSTFILLASLCFLNKNVSFYINKFTTANLASIVGIVGLALLNSVGMIFLYQWGTKYSTPFIASSVTYLGPLTAGLIAIPLFGEKLSFTLIFSFVLICLSLYLAIIRPLKKNAAN